MHTTGCHSNQTEVVDAAQIEACRLDGVSEVLGVLLMAAAEWDGHFDVGRD